MGLRANVLESYTWEIGLKLKKKTQALFPDNAGLLGLCSEAMAKIGVWWFQSQLVLRKQ